MIQKCMQACGSDSPACNVGDENCQVRVIMMDGSDDASSCVKLDGAECEVRVIVIDESDDE